MTEKDVLLMPQQTTANNGVTSRWLYRLAAKLPLPRCISRKNLRFQQAGLQRQIAAKRPDSRR
jgi:hypothetical protein